MFKSKEDLLKEYKKPKGFLYDYYKKGINKAFSSIAERKKFYEIYMDNPEQLYQDFEDLYRKGCDSMFGGFVFPSAINHSKFNRWLYHFCFDGVK